MYRPINIVLAVSFARRTFEPTFDLTEPETHDGAEEPELTEVIDEIEPRADHEIGISSNDDKEFIADIEEESTTSIAYEQEDVTNSPSAADAFTGAIALGRRTS